MEANQLHYVLRPEALSDHSGTATLYLSARSDSSHSVLSDFRPSRGTELVTLSTVDAELEKLWDDVKPHLLVLKIDVEGAEAMVLAGAHRTLAERRPVLVFEVLPGRGETEIATVLEEHAYTLFRPSSSRWVESRTLFGDESYRDRDWVALPSEMAAMANCFLAETDPDSLSPRFVSRRNREADRALSIWVETVLARSNDASRDLATARVQIEEQALELVSQRLATEDMSARVLAAELNLEQEVESLGGICADLRLQVSSLQQQRLEVEEALRRRDEEVRRTELQLQEAIEMNSLHVSMLTQVFRSRSWRWTRWLRRHSRHGWSEQSSTRRGIEQGGQ
jgi:FkbM family methyltransferase